jgi:hypothetical protein
MQAENKSTVVPANITADVEEIVKTIKSAAEQQGRATGDAIRIVRPQGRGMVPGGLDIVILIVGSGATWFTKKWMDAFVWPKIAEVVRKPSEEAIDFVLSRIASIGNEHPQGQRDAERS